MGITNQQLLQELENNEQKIVEQIAEMLVERKVQQFVNLPTAQVKQTVLISVEMVFNYFRTEDIVALEKAIQQNTASRIKQGVLVANVQLATEIIAEGIERAIEQILVDGENSNLALLTSYKERIRIIKTLAQLSASINKRKEN